MRPTAAWGVLRSLFVYWRPGRQRGLRRLYSEFVRPGDVVFDIGAHLGDRSMAFAALGARVVALEPQPRMVRWLKRVVNGHPEITVVEQAVGARQGKQRLSISHATPTVSTLADEWRHRLPETNESFRNVSWPESIEVGVTTLDALINEFGLPSFCKIDVEGFEAQVLAGLSHPIPGLSVEFVQGALDVAAACVARLEALADYEFNVIPGEGRSFAFPTWADASSISHWLQEGAEDMASGDLYARIQTSVVDDPAGTSPDTKAPRS